MAVFEREAAGLRQDLLGAAAEEAADVDRALGTGTLTGEVAREELVERVAGVALGSEVIGHEISCFLKVESCSLKLNKKARLLFPPRDGLNAAYARRPFPLTTFWKPGGKWRSQVSGPWAVSPADSLELGRPY